MIEFKSFGSIENIKKFYGSITQKIHGTNAQIYITEDSEICAGSRNRWLTPEDDNHGFAKFVHQNKEQLIATLGVGRHFGEWAGPGINAGEGLKEKTFLLFNWRRWNSPYQKGELPKQIGVVPVLNYSLSLRTIASDIELALDSLKREGSKLSEGYMRPEGIVIEVNGHFYKKVFDEDEVQWTRKEKVHIPKEWADVSHLLTISRLENVLSKDERLIREYPHTLGEICKTYVQDLHKDEQITGTEEEQDMIGKSLGKKIFKFVKEYMNTN